jgi:hypothetical protein
MLPGELGAVIVRLKIEGRIVHVIWSNSLFPSSCWRSAWSNVVFPLPISPVRIYEPLAFLGAR